MQRHQDRDCREEAGREIDDRITDSRWAAGLGAVDRHQPNHRLQDRVVARKTAKRPISPETGNTAVDQAGEALRQHVLVAESPFSMVPGLKFSTSTSASSRSRISTSRPAGFERSRPTLFLLRLMPMK